MAAGDLDVTVFQNAAGQGKGSVDAALKLAKGEPVGEKGLHPLRTRHEGELEQYQAKN